MLGTHIEEDEQDDMTNKVQLVRVRLPCNKVTESDILANVGEQSTLSKMEVVVEFDHQDEVIKKRACPQN